MKKFIIVFIAIGILSAVYFFRSKTIAFPDFEYDHASALSIDRKMLDTTSDLVIDGSLLPFIDNGTDGQSFLDKNGNPLHPYYSKNNISPEKLSEIHDCLLKPGIFNETKTDCSPIYRDVIVYYDEKDKPVGWMSICFECRKLHFSPNNMHVSRSTFKRLEDVFKTL